MITELVDTITHAVIQNTVLWLMIVGGDAFVFTAFHRLLVGKWWWAKPDTKEWEVRLSDQGWSLSGKGHNPLVTLQKVINTWTGADKTTEEKYQEQYQALVAAETMRLLKTEDVQKQVQQDALANLNRVFASKGAKK